MMSHKLTQLIHLPSACPCLLCSKDTQAVRSADRAKFSCNAQKLICLMHKVKYFKYVKNINTSNMWKFYGSLHKQNRQKGPDYKNSDELVPKSVMLKACIMWVH